MGRRTVLLVVAFLVAALGTGLVFAYVSHVDDRALKDQQPQKVLVVKKLIAQGTPVTAAEQAGDFELKDVAASAIPIGALSDLTPVRSLVALAPLFPGEQVLQAKFGASRDNSILPIPPGKLAVSVQLSDVGRVAGFVQPGAEVAIFVTMNTAVPGQPATERTTTLLPRVPVIAVGPSTAQPAATGTTNPEALPRAIMTLALSQADAQKVIFASTKGAIYFALLDKSSRTSKGGGATLTNLFS
jgi:pilus assembly protein CpaB